jgi:hypothetical protein
MPTLPFEDIMENVAQTRRQLEEACRPIEQTLRMVAAVQRDRDALISGASSALAQMPLGIPPFFGRCRLDH